MRGQPKRFFRNYVPEKKWRRGTSIYMFWFRFMPEMSSALSAAYLDGRAFVCFSACLAVHYFAVYTVWGVKLSKLQLQRQRVQWLCKRALLFLVHFFAAVYKSSQNNNEK